MLSLPSTEKERRRRGWKRKRSTQQAGRNRKARRTRRAGGWGCTCSTQLGAARATSTRNPGQYWPQKEEYHTRVSSTQTRESRLHVGPCQYWPLQHDMRSKNKCELAGDTRSRSSELLTREIPTRTTCFLLRERERSARERAGGRKGERERERES
eukprot:2948384-Rhodomonas_salina.1